MRLFSRSLLILFLSAAIVCGAADESTEAAARKIKSTYLYKFGTYVTWPDGTFASPESPLVIGIAGDDRLADELAAIVYRRLVDNRPVIVKKLQPKESLSGINLLFAADADPSKNNEWLTRTHGLPIVSVSEQNDAMPEDSMINLVADDNRVRFDVSLDAAERNKIKLSSALITVARNVIGRKP